MSSSRAEHDALSARGVVQGRQEVGRRGGSNVVFDVWVYKSQT